MIRIGKLGATLLCLSYLTSCLLFYELGCGSSTTTTTTTSFIRDESFKKKRVSDVNNGTTWRSTDSITTTVLDDTLERAYVASTEMLHVSHGNEEDEYDDVAAVMHRIRILNDCSSSPDCLTNTAANLLLPMPLLITAYYAGQGMGRMIEHTTSIKINCFIN